MVYDLYLILNDNYYIYIPIVIMPTNRQVWQLMHQGDYIFLLSQGCLFAYSYC